MASLSSTEAALTRRQTPTSCETTTSGYLAVRPVNDLSTANLTFAGIVNGVKHIGIDGNSDSIIVTKDDDGHPLAPQEWEFARCSSQDGQSPPPGYQPPSSGPTTNLFGILRPKSATQHCLAIESTNDAQTGARNSVLDSYCTEVPQEYRTFMYVSNVYTNNDGANNLFFADQSTSLVISSTKHAELQFFSRTTKASAMQLVLVHRP